MIPLYGQDLIKDCHLPLYNIGESTQHHSSFSIKEMDHQTAQTRITSLQGSMSEESYLALVTIHHKKLPTTSRMPYCQWYR